MASLWKVVLHFWCFWTILVSIHGAIFFHAFHAKLLRGIVFQVSYALSRLSNITSLLFLLILALGENPDVVFQYKESAAFSNLLFPLLPALLLTCSPSSGSPFSSFWSSCHHFPSNKPRDDLPNSFPRSGMANLHVYTCVSGMVAHILDYMGGWPWLARLKLRLNLTPFDFIFFWLRLWLRSSDTCIPTLNVAFILSASQLQWRCGARMTHLRGFLPEPASAVQSFLLQGQVSSIVNNIH